MKINLKSKKTKGFLIAFLVVLIVGLVIAKKSGVLGKEEITKISTEKVVRHSIIESVTASGKIHPEKEIIIAPDASGEIVGINIKEGDKVKQGDLLLKIKPDFYLSTLDKVKANLNSSKANLANSRARLSQSKAQLLKAESDFKRSEKLYNQKVISDSEFESIKSNYEVAKAEVDAANENVEASKFAVHNAEAGLKEANDNLTKTAVFSPIDGTVSSLTKELGERVSGASEFSSGTEVMRVADLSTMEVRVDVSESDIIRVKLNDTALIEVDAYLNRKFKGIVTQIANSANSTNGVVSTDQVTNFTVKIRILSSSYLDLIDSTNAHISPFRPGMSANVEILTSYVNNVLTVPIQAVTTRDLNPSANENKVKSNASKEEVVKDDQGNETIKSKKSEEKVQEYVFVYESGTVKLQKVTVGIQDNNYFEIKDGLKEGQEIVVAPYRAVSKKLVDKQKVIKVSKESLFDQEAEK